MDKDRLKKELDTCSRCGGCKVLCPTYDAALHEGLSGRGRLMIVRALLDGSLAPSEAVQERLYSCLLCKACTSLCPLNIDIPEAVYAGRALLKDADRRRRTLRRVARFAARRPQISFRMLQLGRFGLLQMLAKRGVIPFSPELPEIPFHAIEQVHKVPHRKGRVAIFAGCSVNYLFPYLGLSLLNLLQALGYEVVLPKEEVCCGAPLRALGLEDDAVRMAQSNYAVFSKLKVDAVLSLCPTCTVSLRDEYRSTIGKGLEKAMDISSFFRDKIAGAAPAGRTAVFHDPCHLLYGLGIRNEPRDLIERSGLALIDAGEPLCCGFGGTFSLTQKDLSTRFRTKQAENLRNTGADVVVTSCPGCLMSLGREMPDRPVLHLVEVLEEAICRDDDSKAEPETIVRIGQRSG